MPATPAPVPYHAPPRLTLTALESIPPIHAGSDIAAEIGGACIREAVSLVNGDVVVVAQKIVSKSEGRRVWLPGVNPSARAEELAQGTGKDARIIELILRESHRVLRIGPETLIVEHRLGFVLANAGIDQSNVGGEIENEYALLLPEDPDRSATELRSGLLALTGADVAIIINDSIGRAWRLGTIGTALGVAGLSALVNLRGIADMHGRVLRSSELAIADELAAAASLCMGQAAEGRPVVVVRGFSGVADDGRGARRLVRPLAQDLFR